MMRTALARVTPLLAALSIAFPAAAADAGPGAPLADIAPKGTTVLVQMPPLKTLWEDFQTHIAPGFVDDDLRKAWAKLWEGKWEREARDIFGMQPLDMLLVHPKRLGCILGDIGPLLRASMEDKTPDPSMVEFAFCIDAGGGKEEFAKSFEQFLDAGVKHAAGKGRESSLRREDYHGAPYFIVTGPAEAKGAEKKDGGTQMSLYAGWVDTWLVATLSKSMLEKMFDVREGAPALSAGDEYRAAKEAIGWKGDEVMLYGDVRSFMGHVKTMAAAQAAREGMGDRAAAQSRLFGDIFDLLAGELTTVAVKSGYAEKAAVSEYFVGCDQGVQPGMLHMLGRKEGLSFPAWTWTGDDAAQVCSAMDAKFLQTLLPKLITMIYAAQVDPSMADAWRAQFSAFFMGLDLEKDLLGSIGERLTVVVDSKASAKADAKKEEDDDAVESDIGAAMGDFLIALELQKTEPWETMLGQINSMTSGAIKKTEYMERKFFVFVDMPSMQLLGGVADGMLLIGTRDMIEQAVRRFGKDLPGLNDAAGLKELAAGAAKPNAMIAHAAQGSFGAEQIRTLGNLMEESIADRVKGMKDSTEKELAEGVLNLMREVLKEKRWADFAPRSLGTASWEARGLRFRSIERWTKPKAAGTF